MEKINYPLISVVMIAYNQEKYIAQAIEGVLNQEYGGEIELILANDHSTDTTDHIVQNIIKNHINGDWIKYTNHSINKGMFKNIIWALKEVKGKYVALCEGDDYWTDPLKLQKQSNFLLNHEEYSMCFHSAKTDNFSNDYKKVFQPIDNRDYSIDEIYNSWIIPTASIVFKSENVISIVSNFKEPKVFNWDIILILTCFNFGKVRGISDQMSVYQFQDNGLSIFRMKKDKLQYLNNNLGHHDYIRKKFTKIDSQFVDIKFFHIHMEMANLYFLRNSVKCIPHFLKGMYYRPSILWNGFIRIFK
jgi:glycosyltransferase involved in cell wall biosynthesis